MIVGIGSDIVSVQRIREAAERHGRRFLDRIFTADELAYGRGKAREFEHLAARFAAKEALAKALGTGVSDGILLSDAEVRNNADGKPEMVLRGRACEAADALGVRRIHLSLSHADVYAVAFVVLET